MWKALAAGIVVAVVAGLFIIVPRWQERPRQYSHGTPEELVDAFATMIEQGDVDRIPELIWAEDEAMRQTLAQLGALLAEMQLLGLSVNDAFPGEVDRLRREAEEAAARGEATSLLGRLGQSAMPGRGNQSRRPGGQGDSINLAIRALLASPYETLDEARDRLTVLEINEGLGGLMWDGQMVLPPFGMSVKQDLLEGGTGDWYIVLPLDLPFVSRYRPRTEQQWFIAGALMQAWRNAAVDIREGIESGSIRSLSEATSELGATVGVPTAMIAVAYSKQFEDSGG
ncbi:MAG: hypothetical protein AAFO89_00830 [Planctomycetota bacterium]